MILADSSAWIDYLANRPTIEADALHRALADDAFATLDIVLTEVLRGCSTEREAERVGSVLTAFPVVRTLDEQTAIVAARIYRDLRSQGITVRGTVDTLIAARCLVDNHVLLYRDRDFDAIVRHLGLRSYLNERFHEGEG